MSPRSWRSASSSARQGGEFGVGDHDLVGLASAGELDVGGLAGERVDADGDGHVPGASLGAVGRQCVGVGEVAASVEVASDRA